MKQCLKCKQTKQFTHFSKDKSRNDGYTIYCKECKNKAKRQWTLENKEKVAAYDKKWQSLNKDKKSKNYKNWQQNNRADVNVYNSFVRAAKLKRTPLWADQEKIKAYYDVCAFFNEVNGYIKYHVDHVVPLQGKLVSGLHVQNNLQVLLAKDNCSKGNKHG